MLKYVYNIILICHYASNQCKNEQILTKVNRLYNIKIKFFSYINTMNCTLCLSKKYQFTTFDAFETQP